MQMKVNERNKVVTSLLNSTLTSLDGVIPINYTRSAPKLLKQNFNLEFGVLIGIVGDVNGKLVLSGELPFFSEVGQTMYGMPLEGEMLLSFSGELGNMVAGGLSSNIASEGIDINITSPTIMQGNTTLSGFKQGISVAIAFESTGDLALFLLID
ncbi:chemotaxis protein CheX [Virgibacillus sp. YIM 98842]|jgi:chemotaxis protein CheX|uniref:chemotaxis protein CheX n=1 Tax=Virgibacillus sp. YIM 98842 TaxID=2663533 RepID=UPI0013DD0A37|nr:chemotaxis protein CheX [Virgibacillus sp. YIM 98842]